MKLGIIIVFDSFESPILKEELILKINELSDVTFCLVNNKCDDRTTHFLSEISECCSNANVINIRRGKSVNSATRAGARFLYNQFNLMHMGFINGLSNIDIIEIFKLFKVNQEKILSRIINERIEKGLKQTLFKRLFCINEYLVDLKAVG